jgi:hypothetical protein
LKVFNSEIKISNGEPSIFLLMIFLLQNKIKSNYSKRAYGPFL